MPPPPSGLSPDCQTASEALVELGGGAVVEQRHASGERETAMRSLAVGGLVVVAALEARVHADRLELHGVQRDLVGAR